MDPGGAPQWIVNAHTSDQRAQVCTRPRRPSSPLLPNLVFSTHTTQEVHEGGGLAYTGLRYVLGAHDKDRSSIICALIVTFGVKFLACCGFDFCAVRIEYADCGWHILRMRRIKLPKGLVRHEDPHWLDRSCLVRHPKANGSSAIIRQADPACPCKRHS